MLRQFVGQELAIGRAIQAEDELDALVVGPAIEMLRLTEVGVAAQEHLAKAALQTNPYGAIDLGRGPFVRGTIALLLEGLTGQLAEQAQLQFAHGPLQSQEQTVVDLLGIVNAMIVDDHRVGHSAQIEEMMPVAIVLREPRCFECQHKRRPRQPQMAASSCPKPGRSTRPLALLPRSSSMTTNMRNPARLKRQIGVLMVLHTWGQNLHHHPHVHCVVHAAPPFPESAVERS